MDITKQEIAEQKQGQVIEQVAKQDTEQVVEQVQPNKVTENNLYWAKTKSNAIIPTKKDENAGYDIYACFDEDRLLIYPHETVTVPTGIAVAISEGYYIQVQERGSTGTIGLKYGAGVIDSGYRGEVFVVLTNTNEYPIIITKEDTEKISLYPYTKGIYYPYEKAIAQLVVHEVPKMLEHEITYEELLMFDSDRGTGSLGSTNK